MAGIAVFVCHCGHNIAATVDVESLSKRIADIPGVVYAEDYKYMCSSTGQERITKIIQEYEPSGIVVAACSPHMHEVTFRNACLGAGLNPYRCEIANIREQCSWVHKDKKLGTEKAFELIRSIIEKTKKDKNLEPTEIPVTRRVLVIGGGIAGMQAALDTANCGIETIIVERSSSIGGRMAQLSETFPTLDCSQCILTPKMVEVSTNPNTKIYAYSELESISGYVGNFTVTIRKKARYVDENLCTGCGTCWEKCPAVVESEFNKSLGKRKAIFTLFPQAVPNVPVIDRGNCIYFERGKCRICEKVCEASAVKFEDEDELIEEKVGAIIVATGFDLYPIPEYEEYGYGEIKDVISGLQFERLASASGPTQGKIQRPSDGEIAKKIVFVSCVGSRDRSHNKGYCSKICCMYMAKHAILYKHLVPDGEAYAFYMDLRAGGKNFDEFSRRAMEEEGAVYYRGRVSKIYEKNEYVVVKGFDTLSQLPIEIEADLVVLATGIKPRSDTKELAQTLGISYDQHGFFTEAHPKLKPVETNKAGIFLAGVCQGPKDIPETVSQAGCAAAKVVALFSEGKLRLEPIVVQVIEDLCAGCGMCVDACPYGAREMDEVKGVAKVIQVLCQGCGACAAVCPNKATVQNNFRPDQIVAMAEEFFP